tara:strand:+ start:582 stop:722 length:141 start_codon:yes stop_codon:yes gene_type:complete
MHVSEHDETVPANKAKKSAITAAVCASNVAKASAEVKIAAAARGCG